jgi:hypothetical protein
MARQQYFCSGIEPQYAEGIQIEVGAPNAIASRKNVPPIAIPSIRLPKKSRKLLLNMTTP